MIEFIVKYWVEFIFGIIATGAIAIAKRFYSLYKNEKKNQEQAEQTELKNAILDIVEKNKSELHKEDIQIYDKMNSIQTELAILKSGILGMWGRQFISDCKVLLKPDHVINQREWDDISKDHEIYNLLGGNHNGDRLYEDIVAKYRNNLK